VFPLELESRLSAIETAIAVVASREPDLLDLVIDVLQKERSNALAADDESYSVALLDARNRTARRPLIAI